MVRGEGDRRGGLPCAIAKFRPHDVVCAAHRIASGEERLRHSRGDRERKLIKKIEESLELIETGEYGFCESCGAEIGIRRLEARPTATLCIDCKTIDEIREKQEIG